MPCVPPGYHSRVPCMKCTQNVFHIPRRRRRRRIYRLIKSSRHLPLLAGWVFFYRPQIPASSVAAHAWHWRGPIFHPNLINPSIIPCFASLASPDSEADPSLVIHDAPSALGVAKSHLCDPHHHRHRPDIPERVGETLPSCLAFRPSLPHSTYRLPIVRRCSSCF